jgi:hypothetical protein
MTITELASKANTATNASKEKPRFKKIAVGIAAGIVAGALCGFTYAGVNGTHDPKANEKLATDIQTVAAKVDAIIMAPGMQDVRISIASHGNTGNLDFDEIKSDPNLQDLVWSVQGTSDAYCVKAYSKIGGEEAKFNPTTYDSKLGLGSMDGACNTKIVVTSVDVPTETVTPEIGGSAGKQIQSPIGVMEPEDNTDIR